MTLILAIIIGTSLAYANGANDNFKGVATLFGSGTTEYKKALSWATVTTLLGSIVALVLAQGLIATFSGKGLVPDGVISMRSFPLSVALASALTVMIATRLGFPISTTHALMGSLVGAGLLASTSGINWAKLGSSFFLPLLISPVLAVTGAFVIYPIFRFARVRLGIKKETCLCMGNEVIATVPVHASTDQTLAMRNIKFPDQNYSGSTVRFGTETSCHSHYTGNFLGISAKPALDFLHFLSAGVVSFARGLNDTPKIAAILLAGGVLSPAFAIVGVAVAIALGGLFNAKKVAETMSLRVTDMDPGQGFSANIVTGAIVIFASKLGVPVSTTHVSCGSLFGIGTVSRQAHWKTIASILTAWITTLPMAAILGALSFYLLKGVII